MSGTPLRKVTLHPGWHNRHQGFVSAFRGFRNAVIAGVRIRLPYVIQAAIYVAVFYPDPLYQKRLKFVIKQIFQHGRNLGTFVFIYKSICFILRRGLGISGGLESWIAGFIGGYIGFGDSTGISGSVNNQVVLYLFARGIFGLMQSSVKRGLIPRQSFLDVKSKVGFRVLAGFSLALILYLTEYEPDTLRPSFMTTMNNLYYDSDVSPQQFLPSARFLLFFITVSLSLLGTVVPSFSLDNLLFQLIG
eukprot:TRINITY_DN459_c0_g1_i1.p1 TRINITY_DN459_c0_g1~~TRINITY_DN459_c0_g1_i1.p1  ORF type:complete len:247 (+),score=8.56 TRINITY_DN459_c0_g1_i1:103-843(+)